jgi:plastocyanin
VLPRAALRPLALVGCALAAVGVAGCDLTSGNQNTVNGKTLFVAKCGACHTLARAGTKGTTGPDLDAAFARARTDGIKESTIQGMVSAQIQYPARLPQLDPVTEKPTAMMPPKLVTGGDAQDVAAYIAATAAVPGKDSGRLAAVGGGAAKGTAQEKGGVLTIPADPGGQLFYVFKDAVAQAGKVEVESPNKASIAHDIVIEGNGVNAKGPEVKDGGVSKVSADLKPGTYTFFCSVPGHRQAGMEGKLTVK